MIGKQQQDEQQQHAQASEPATPARWLPGLPGGLPRLRLLAAVLLLVAVLWVVDAQAALALIVASDVRWLLVGLVLVQLQIAGSAWRWWLTARSLGQGFGLSHAIGEYYLATLVNQTLPGGITGDAARAVRTRHSVTSVVLERLAGQLALGAVTVTGLLLWPLLSDRSLPGAAASIGWISAGVLVLLALAMGWSRRSSSTVGTALQSAWIRDGAWWRQGLLSLAIVGSYLALFAVAGLALNQPLPVSALISVVPLALMTMLLPVSIGGWGVREAAAAALWPAVGLGAEAGVATSILYGLMSLAGSLPAVWLLVRRA